MIETPHVNLGYFIIGAAGSLKCSATDPAEVLGPSPNARQSLRWSQSPIAIKWMRPSGYRLGLP